MQRAYFQSIENQSEQSRFSLLEIIDQLAFNESGLIPVITQDATTKTVLMMAWMNRQALEKTLETGWVTYFSRSRQALWVKGLTSGHKQKLVEMRFDCDGDAILCLAEQTGAACHTGRPHCFYLKVDANKKRVEISSPAVI